MKKYIATAFAATALAVGGAASAQDLGSTILNILGFGQPTYNYGQTYGYNSGYPAVVAPQAQVYSDAYGRQFYYDQYGQQIYLQSQYQQPRTIVGYDAWGRPIYGATSYSYNTYGYNSWDRDGDGVSNSRDRWPDDPRYR